MTSCTIIYIALFIHIHNFFPTGRFKRQPIGFFKLFVYTRDILFGLAISHRMYKVQILLFFYYLRSRCCLLSDACWPKTTTPRKIKTIQCLPGFNNKYPDFWADKL